MFSFFFKIKKTFLLFKKAYGPYKFQIIILACIGFASGILEGIGVNALIPFFSFVTGQPFEGTNAISTFIESAFYYFHIDFAVKYLLIFIVVLFIMKAILVFAGKYIQNFIAVAYGKNLRMLFLREMLQAEWNYLSKQKTGHASTVLIMEIQAATKLLRTISAVVLTVTTISVYVFMALLISWTATIFTFGLGFLLIVSSKPLIDRARYVIREKVASIKDTTHFINEVTLGAKTIKSFRAAEAIFFRGESFFEHLRRLQLHYFIYRGVISSIIQPLSIVFISAIFIFLYKSPGFNLGSFIALVYLVQRIFTHINQLDSDVHNINTGIPYLQSIISYLEKVRAQKEKDKGTKPFLFKEKLEMKNLSFSYDGKKYILNDVYMTLSKGKAVGIIGPSGAGKTTLVDIILRLLPPQRGMLLLDGQNAETIALAEWRKSVGYVSQDIHLINDTVANNIAFYLPLSREAMERAAKDAGIYDFIKKLPRGFDSVIGERGIKFSTGQRQRIAIARALARSPQILIFDEATSALDNESEVFIQKTIEGLKRKMTVVVIAHRLDTVLNCDTVIVLKNGHIIEQGAPKKLLENKDSYFFKTYNIRKHS